MSKLMNFATVLQYRVENEYFSYRSSFLKGSFAVKKHKKSGR